MQTRWLGGRRSPRDAHRHQYWVVLGGKVGAGSHPWGRCCFCLRLSYSISLLLLLCLLFSPFLSSLPFLWAPSSCPGFKFFQVSPLTPLPSPYLPALLFPPMVQLLENVVYTAVPPAASSRCRALRLAALAPAATLSHHQGALFCFPWWSNTQNLRFTILTIFKGPVQGH